MTLLMRKLPAFVRTDSRSAVLSGQGSVVLPQFTGTSGHRIPVKDLHRRLVVHEIQATASSPAGISLSGQHMAVEKQPALPAGRVISQLKMVSGLTWAELAGILGVSQRSLHNWQNGERLTSSNERFLRTLFDVILRADRGSAQRNARLLRSVTDGQSPLDLLRARRFAQASKLLGPGAGRKESAGALDAEERESREPVRTEYALGTLPHLPPVAAAETRYVEAKRVKRHGRG